MKEKSQENSLGVYLTNKKISNIEIYSKTGIPTVELSKLRSGRITRLSAEKLYAISLVAQDDIGETLKLVFPNLVLKKVPHHIGPNIKSNKFTKIGSYLNSIEENSLETISQKTDITLSRLKDLKTKQNAIPLADELYILELAIGKNPGELYKILYKDKSLNTDKIQEKLLAEERAKAAAKKKSK